MSGPEGKLAAGPRAGTRLALPSRARRALLTLHIGASVALLGDSAGFLAVAIRASGIEDPARAAESYRTLEMFSLAFGIPLSFAALLSGLALGLSSRWGVLRYPWVIAKLGLIVTVIGVGALVLNAGIDTALDGGDADLALIAGSGWDVFALLLATTLAVFKPGPRVGVGSR